VLASSDRGLCGELNLLQAGETEDVDRLVMDGVALHPRAAFETF
jgi:hypothetical protein